MNLSPSRYLESTLAMDERLVAMIYGYVLVQFNCIHLQMLRGYMYVYAVKVRRRAGVQSCSSSCDSPRLPRLAQQGMKTTIGA